MMEQPETLLRPTIFWHHIVVATKEIGTLLASWNEWTLKSKLCINGTSADFEIIFQKSETEWFSFLSKIWTTKSSKTSFLNHKILVVGYNSANILWNLLVATCCRVPCHNGLNSILKEDSCFVKIVQYFYESWNIFSNFWTLGWIRFGLQTQDV